MHKKVELPHTDHMNTMLIVEKPLWENLHSHNYRALLCDDYNEDQDSYI